MVRDFAKENAYLRGDKLNEWYKPLLKGFKKASDGFENNGDSFMESNHLPLHEDANKKSSNSPYKIDLKSIVKTLMK